MSGSDTVTMTAAELEAMLGRAAEAGAKKALHSVGLHDDKASHDVRDLRNLLESFRDAKREAKRAVMRVLTTWLLTALLAGAAVTWWRQ